jgi:hypothetical protein
MPTVLAGLALLLLSVLPALAASVTLVWNPNTDNPDGTGVAGYYVYRNGVRIGQSATTTYVDATAASGTQYTYTVTALDAVGNESGQSIAAVVTTSSATLFSPLHKYYIAPSGCSDANNGTSPATPWCTPNHTVVCGDVIIALPGTYSSGQFSGTFGQVNNCPSSSGGVNGTGGIYFAVLLCGRSDLMSCQATGAPYGNPVFGFRNGTHNWAVQGFVVPNVTGSRAFEVRIINDACNAALTSHHIASINNVVYGSLQAFGLNDCGKMAGLNPPAADYLAVVGTIAQNAVLDRICLGAIDFVGTGQTDSNTSAIKGFMYGNFAWSNRQPSCNGQYDEEGLMLDTLDAHSSNGIWIVKNNTVWNSGRYGIQLFYQRGSAVPVTAKILNNTFFANNAEPIQQSASWTMGEINTAISSNPTSPAPYTLIIKDNIAKTNWPTAGGAGGSPIYPLQIGGRWAGLTVTGNILKGLQTQCLSTCDSTNSLIVWDGNIVPFGNIFADPLFTNPAHLLANYLGAPNCAGFTNVTACMGYDANTGVYRAQSVLDDLKPTASAAAGKGYQIPSTACIVSDPDYPPWLKGIVYLQVSGDNIVVANDLVTKPCGM